MDNGLLYVYPVLSQPNRDDSDDTEHGVGFILRISGQQMTTYREPSERLSSTLPPLSRIIPTPVQYVPSAWNFWRPVVAVFQTYLCGLSSIHPQSQRHVSPEPVIDSEFRRIVPPSLYHHLVVVTPPVLSTFPQRYPLANFPPQRVWKSEVDTEAEVERLLGQGAQIVRMDPILPDLVGVRQVSPGDVVFIEEVAYYVTADIGQMPISRQFPDKTIALEARTLQGTLVLLFLPRMYVAEPVVFEQIVWGQMEEEHGKEEEQNEE